MSAESYRKVLCRIGMGQSPGVGEINRENLPLNDLPPGAWKQTLAEPGTVSQGPRDGKTRVGDCRMARMGGLYHPVHSETRALHFTEHLKKHQTFESLSYGFTISSHFISQHYCSTL